jgi:hypothetical protein
MEHRLDQHKGDSLKETAEAQGNRIEVFAEVFAEVLNEVGSHLEREDKVQEDNRHLGMVAAVEGKVAAVEDMAAAVEGMHYC